MKQNDDELFFKALDYDTPEQREQWLKITCGSDSDQYSRVLKLVRTHFGLQFPETSKPSLLDQADSMFRAFSSSHEMCPGDVVGGVYELKELIGEGGVGAVYRAQQRTPFEREVAIKLLKPGMDTQRILARFALERQALEQLDHPGITRVFDAGFQENGRPYFAMELVRNARTITAYCEDLRLALQQRMQLMISVCQTVQYAHQRGIIHRDLKPSNILLEGTQPTNSSPKVIDFGIAKFMTGNESETRGFTSLGERFGTPAYMSPEQALSPSGDIDIRTDVYSLGVVLFELLTGTVPRSSSCEPQQTKWADEGYWTQPVPHPSQKLREFTKTQATLARPTLSPIVPTDVQGELDWIVTKSLALERNERYQTVADLQKDLERFLAGQPVDAAGPSVSYRAKKFVVRNRVAVAAASLTFIAIVSTSLVAISLALRAFRAEKTSSVRLAEVLRMQAELTTQRDAAKAAARKAESLLRIFQIQTATGRALSIYFQELFTAVGDPATMGPDRLARLATDIDAPQLVNPHERLIVRGDWQWTADPFPDEIMAGALQFTSKEAAALVSASTNSPTPRTEGSEPDPTNTPTSSLENKVSNVDAIKEHQSKNQANFQDTLLNELRKVVGNEDPLIAEVLDNRGLNAIENGELISAQELLAEAVTIWSRSNQYPANVVQSKLFLAEACLKSKDTEKAKILLRDAASLLEKIPATDPYFAPLERVYRELSGN